LGRRFCAGNRREDLEDRLPEILGRLERYDRFSWPP
jgi:hypothetical protein